MRALAALALTLLGLASAPAQVVRLLDRYLVRFDWVEGQTYRFRTTVEATIPGLPAVAPTTELTMRVTNVKDGVATLEYSAGSLRATAQVDRRGRVRQGSAQTLTAYAPGAVGLGESWTVEGSETTELGPARRRTTYTVMAVRGDRDRPDVDVRVDSNLTGDGFSGLASGTLTIAGRDGMTLASDVRTTLKQTVDGQSIELTVRVRVVRL